MVWNRSTQHVVRFHAQNNIKVFFNIVKDLFKSIEGLDRSVKIPKGPKAEEIIVLGGLR